MENDQDLSGKSRAKNLFTPSGTDANKDINHDNPWKIIIADDEIEVHNDRLADKTAQLL